MSNNLIDLPNFVVAACAQAHISPGELKQYIIHLPNLYTDNTLDISLVTRDERRFTVKEPVHRMPEIGVCAPAQARSPFSHRSAH